MGNRHSRNAVPISSRQGRWGCLDGLGGGRGSLRYKVGKSSEWLCSTYTPSK